MCLHCILLNTLTPLVRTPRLSPTLHPPHTLHGHHISDGSRFIVTISPHGTDKTHSISLPPHAEKSSGVDQCVYSITSHYQSMAATKNNDSFMKCSLCRQTTIALYYPICIHTYPQMKYRNIMLLEQCPGNRLLS